MSLAGEPASLNPNLRLDPGPDEFALIVGQNLFSKLISLTADGTILPDLATRWEESDDGVNYTFHLREGVRWHDGRPFTAEDVRATLARVRVESSNRDLADHIASADVLDERTVRVQLTSRWAAFIPSLAWYGAAILPAHVYASGAWRDHPANTQPVGTGPFRFKEWERGRRIVLEKNDDYYGPGPYVDSLEYLIVPSPEAGVPMLLDGRVDLLLSRPAPERVHELSRTKGIRVTTAPGDGRTYIGFNLRSPVFGDLRVRRAVSLAIDRRALVDRALFGLGAPAVGFYTPAVAWAYNGDARAPEFDLPAARRLFKAVPASFSATLVAPGMTSMRYVAEEIARQLRDAGLPVNIVLTGPREYFQRLMDAHDFDLALMSGSQGPDPDNMSTRFSSRGSQQFMGYASAQLDAQLSRGAAQTDVLVRTQAYHRAQELLAADLPIVPLSESVRVSVCRVRLRGLPSEDARGLVPDYTFNLVRLRPR
jgi:ABC-type transport system substrate-binding protein